MSDATSSAYSLLKNMFDPKEETGNSWDTELREDVKQEAEDKYGPVADIYVSKDSAVRVDATKSNRG